MNSQTRHPFENCKHKNGSLCEKKNMAEEHILGTIPLISLGFSYLKLLLRTVTGTLGCYLLTSCASGSRLPMCYLNSRSD